MRTIQKVEKACWSMYIISLVVFWIIQQVDPVIALVPAITCVLGLIGITILPSPPSKNEKVSETFPGKEDMMDTSLPK
ncbi:hypothetical protein RG959_19215 [Domibacillus sp. 8LH]|uniref:hypothetical protein n=1 Tax=Domibacillus sp. 8LH TaxID=3073900 RepID=UPI003170D079